MLRCFVLWCKVTVNWICSWAWWKIGHIITLTSYLVLSRWYVQTDYQRITLDSCWKTLCTQNVPFSKPRIMARLRFLWLHGFLEWCFFRALDTFFILIRALSADRLTPSTKRQHKASSTLPYKKRRLKSPMYSLITYWFHFKRNGKKKESFVNCLIKWCSIQV